MPVLSEIEVDNAMYVTVAAHLATTQPGIAAAMLDEVVDTGSLTLSQAWEGFTANMAPETREQFDERAMHGDTVPYLSVFLRHAHAVSIDDDNVVIVFDEHGGGGRFITRAEEQQLVTLAHACEITAHALVADAAAPLPPQQDHLVHGLAGEQTTVVSSDRLIDEYGTRTAVILIDSCGPQW